MSTLLHESRHNDPDSSIGQEGYHAEHGIVPHEIIGSMLSYQRSPDIDPPECCSPASRSVIITSPVVRKRSNCWSLITTCSIPCSTLILVPLLRNGLLRRCIIVSLALSFHACCSRPSKSIIYYLITLQLCICTVNLIITKIYTIMRTDTTICLTKYIHINLQKSPNQRMENIILKLLNHLSNLLDVYPILLVLNQ